MCVLFVSARRLVFIVCLQFVETRSVIFVHHRGMSAYFCDLISRLLCLLKIAKFFLLFLTLRKVIVGIFVVGSLMRLISVGIIEMR